MNASSTTIRNISDLVTKGTTPTTLGRRFTQRGVRFIKVETISPDGHYLPNKIAFIDSATHNLLRRSQLKEGDILFSIAGALGRSTIVQAAWLPANTNQAFAVIRPSRRSRTTPRYLLWALRSDSIQNRIKEINVQAAQANLSLEQVRDFEIIVPDPTQQQNIADALDSAEELITSLERMILKKRAIKQGMMQELLTGRVRLPGFSEQWVQCTIGDMTHIFSGGTPKSSVSLYWDGGIAWCTPTDITRERTRYLRTTERTISREGLDKSSAHLLPKGAILLCTRATIGELKIAVGPIATNQGFKSLVPKPGVSSEFIYYRMMSIKDILAGYGTGSTFLEVSKRDVAGLVLKMPSSKEQHEIGHVLSAVDDEIDVLVSRLAKAKAVKQGMMQELLTGRTQLPIEEAAI